MSWFKVYLTYEQAVPNGYIKLQKDFYKLCIENQTPEGMALYSDRIATVITATEMVITNFLFIKFLSFQTPSIGTSNCTLFFSTITIVISWYFFFSHLFVTYFHV